MNDQKLMDLQRRMDRLESDTIANFIMLKERIERIEARLKFARL